MGACPSAAAAAPGQAYSEDDGRSYCCCCCGLIPSTTPQPKGLGAGGARWRATKGVCKPLCMRGSSSAVALPSPATLPTPTRSGDEEELDRFAGELGMREKGKVYVRGILER